jgi:L-amino acid N-acyltransferase YncA
VSAASLRAATDADLPAVAALWAQLTAFHHSLGLTFPHSADAPEKWLASFQRTLGRFSFLWLAEVDGAPQAFLLARVKQSPAFLGAVQVGEISDLFVADSLRGSGAGKQLVELAMQKFDELNVHSVEVQIQAGNDAGLDFWHKQDFKNDLTLVRRVLKGGN